MFKNLVIAITLVVLFLVGMFLFKWRHLSIEEIDFTDSKRIDLAIETGWLPSWFPSAAREVRGAQRTFDGSFIWITFRVPTEALMTQIVSNHCEESNVGEVKLPEADYIGKFPEHVKRTYSFLLSAGQSANFFVCADGSRTIYLAMDTESRAYLWSY